MLTLNGKHNSAIVYTDVIEPEAISQIISVCNLESSKNNIIRLMPDVHPGKGCTIGTTIKLNNGKVIPNLVGSDIGCGVLCIKLNKSRIDLPKLDSEIRRIFESKNQVTQGEKIIDSLLCKKHIYKEKALSSLGTLGGGNHFLEIDKDAEGYLYLIIHSGSRRLGTEVCNYYQNLAHKILKETNSNISQFTSYLEGYELENYLKDMNLVCEFASLNRRIIAEKILKTMKLKSVEEIDTIHNYIDSETMILRKGAVSALKNEQLIIPINMREGSLICNGLGNPEWNYSAPHGAGRLFSRADSKSMFTLSEFKKTMKEAGIYSTSINSSTLDECPMAYKDINQIIDNISDTVEIQKIIKPIYNFKSDV